MLRATPVAWYSSTFSISDGGREVGRLRLARLRERAAFAVNDVPFALYRDGPAGDFVLDFHEAVLARADKPSAFSDSFHVEVDGATFRLEKDSSFKRAFVLRARDTGEVVGRIAPTRWFTRTTEISLPDALPLPVQVFCLWLVLLMWNRAAASA